MQSQLRTTYSSQAASITVTNGGEPSERILDGNQRFPGVFDANRPEVVLLMEGVNGLPLVGPDISTGIMRIMVQKAKNGGARVFVGSMIPQVAGTAARDDAGRASCWPTTTRCRSCRRRRA